MYIYSLFFSEITNVAASGDDNEDDNEDNDDEDNKDDDDDDKRPGWLKFIYKSLDFGSGRERGARK